jgi:hypothetical protein
MEFIIRWDFHTRWQLCLSNYVKIAEKFVKIDGKFVKIDGKFVKIDGKFVKTYENLSKLMKICQNGSKFVKSDEPRFGKRSPSVIVIFLGTKYQHGKKIYQITIK